ncbi:MAG: cache domain-containing protein, partial [Burkholderiaceae bacterium]
MRITSLHVRIALLFALLMLVVQGVGFVVIRTVISANALSNVEAELMVTDRVFQQVLRSNREKLSQAAAIIAADFGFRKAVASDSRATVESALANQADRIGADVAMLVSLDGVLLANSREPNQAAQPFGFPDLLKAAEADGNSASALGTIDGQVYQLVAVPVKAPVAIAWVTMGFRIDDALAQDMRGLTSADVSFLVRSPEGAWNVLASSLSAANKTALRQHFASFANPASLASVLELGPDEYATRTIEIAADGAPVVVVLQRSLKEAVAPFARLQQVLLILTVIGLLVSVGASLFTARGVTRPIANLIRSTRRIGAGEYTGEIEVTSQDEIGELALAFNQMRTGIAEREQRIMHLAYQDPLTDLPNRALFNERLN